MELIEKAIFNEEKIISFYPVVKTLGAEKFTNHPDFVKINNNVSANIGASSIFKINTEKVFLATDMGNFVSRINLVIFE